MYHISRMCIYSDKILHYLGGKMALIANFLRNVIIFLPNQAKTQYFSLQMVIKMLYLTFKKQVINLKVILPSLAQLKLH